MFYAILFLIGENSEFCGCYQGALSPCHNSRIMAAKRMKQLDPVREREARDFIRQVTGEPLDGDLQEALKNGIVLCNMLNILRPGSVSKIQNSRMPFVQMVLKLF